MGIEKYNIATCDKCKKEYRSAKSQQALKKELLDKGWTFKGDNAFCNKCSDIKPRLYTGSIKEVKKIGPDYYALVSNGAMDVYILYNDFISLNANSLPSLIYLREYLIKQNKDPDNVQYKGTRKVTIEGNAYFVADYCS